VATRANDTAQLANAACAIANVMPDVRQPRQIATSVDERNLLAGTGDMRDSMSVRLADGDSLHVRRGFDGDDRGAGERGQNSRKASGASTEIKDACGDAEERRNRLAPDPRRFRR
jgi:hypothetical protein